ncbi:MAG: hypothetical protein DRI86_09365 [Bacteroidetes bacterium]|nr:MAG: hypothetical protein DRI86_09365 [Bacteroidota bacterium]
MIVRYTKLSKYSKLFMGIAWFLVGALNVFYGETKSINYFFIVFGIIYFVMAFVEFAYNYVEIENGIISKKGPFGKNLKIIDLIKMEEAGRELVIRTMDKKITINKMRANSDDYLRLIEEIKKQKQSLAVV